MNGNIAMTTVTDQENTEIRMDSAGVSTPLILVPLIALIAATLLVLNPTLTHAAGSVDESWATDGTWVLPVGDSCDLAPRMKLLNGPDDTVYVITSTQNCSGSDLVADRVTIARLNADGTLDDSFGQAGTGVSVPTPGIIQLGDMEDGQDCGVSCHHVLSATTHPDGGILIGGVIGDWDELRNDWDPGFRDLFVAQLDDNGVLDDSFGGAAQGGPYDGVSTAGFVFYSAVMDLAVMSTGHIALAVTTDADDPGSGNLGSGALLMESDGNIIEFVIIPHFGTRDNARAIHIHSDNTIRLVDSRNEANTASTSTGWRRFNTSLDPISNFTQSEVMARASHLMDDDRFIMGGSSLVDPGGDMDAVVLRMTSFGTLDTDFANSGQQVMNFGSSGFDTVTDLSIDGEDRILAAVTADERTSSQSAHLVRLNADGSIDTGFGDSGMVELDAGVGNITYDVLAVDGDDVLVSWSCTTCDDGAQRVTRLRGSEAPVLDGPPNNLRQTFSTVSRITIAWDAPTSGATPTSYILRHRRTNGTWRTREKGVSSRHTESDLRPNRQYSIRVGARYEPGGVIHWTPEITVRTRRDVAPPTRPGSPRAVRLAPRALVLGWNPSTDNHMVQRYDVGLVTRRNGRPYARLLGRVSAPNRMIMLRGATPGRTYTFVVRAVDPSGNKRVGTTGRVTMPLR